MKPEQSNICRFYNYLSKVFNPLLFLLPILILTTNIGFASEENNPERKDQISEYDRLSFDDNNIMVSQINLSNNLLLSESVTAYNDNGQIFISLAEFTNALAFPIKIEDEGTRAMGWFIDEKRSFSLDLHQNLSVSAGIQTPINPDTVILHDGELFVSPILLKKWFKISASFDPLSQVIRIEIPELLPIEEKMQRDQKWEETNHERELQKKEVPGTNIKAPYKLASIPLTDMRYSYNYTKPKDDSAQSKLQLDTLMSGDFLHLGHQLFLSTTDDGGIIGARLTSGKKDADGKLLGPLNATEFSIGDVFTPLVPLTARSQSGKGAQVTNFPETYTSQFDNVDIRGNAQPGWDVELYRNDSLLNFTTVPSTGLYEFLKVPLVSGVNIMKLIFYGPYGQRREQITKYYMNEDLIKKGQFYYRVTANKNNDNLIKTNDDNQEITAKDGKGRFFGEASYGVTKTTSVAANLSQLPLDNTGQIIRYGGASVRSSLFGIYGRFDLVKDLDNNLFANETSLQTRVFGYDITTKYDSYDKDFVSEDKTLADDPLMNKTSLRIDGSFKIPNLPPIRSTFNGIKEHYNSKNERFDLSQEFSTTVWNKLNITQSFKRIIDERIEEKDQRITDNGKTLLNLRVNNELTLRGSLDYNFTPKTELSSSTATALYNFKSGYITNLNYNHQFGSDNQDSGSEYIINVSKIFDKFIASIGGSYGNLTGYSINATLSVSFGYDIKNNVGAVSARPMANNGAVSTRVFLDENNNSRYDAGEENLSDIKLGIDNNVSLQQTNENGSALITQLPTDRPTKITLKADSLFDPYWVSTNPPVNLRSHPGSITHLDFPIIPTGEIEGSVSIMVDGLKSEASNVQVVLVNENERIIKTATTSFDGFFLISAVPYGKYKLRVSEEQMARLRLGGNAEHIIEINGANPSFRGIEFTIGMGLIDQFDRPKNKPKTKFKVKIKGYIDEDDEDDELPTQFIRKPSKNSIITIKDNKQFEFKKGFESNYESENVLGKVKESEVIKETKQQQNNKPKVIFKTPETLKPKNQSKNNPQETKKFEFKKGTDSKSDTKINLRNSNNKKPGTLEKIKNNNINKNQESKKFELKKGKTSTSNSKTNLKNSQNKNPKILGTVKSGNVNKNQDQTKEEKIKKIYKISNN